MSDPIQRYNAVWPGTLTDLQIELAAIKYGGYWTTKGKMCGEGLSTHFENARRIIWPELDGEHNGQRWHKLCRDAICTHKVSVLMGPGSSSKTHSAAWIYLVDYFADPDNTCVLVSSTDRRGLKLRVWGELASLWEKAVERFPFLPGHMLDSALAITTEELDDVDADDRKVRDMRKGIIGIPTMQGSKFVGLGKWCQVAGTLIDTATGPRPIETITPGDLVWCAAGLMPVEATCNRLVPEVIRLTLNNGTQITTTGDHPFFTSSGWVNAVDLLPEHELITTHEAMQILLESNSCNQSKADLLQQKMQKQRSRAALSDMQKANHGSQAGETLLQPRMQGKAMGETMCTVRHNFYPKRGESDFLFSTLFSEMEMAEPGLSRKNACLGSARNRIENQCRHSQEQKGNGSPKTRWDKAGENVRGMETLQHHRKNPIGKRIAGSVSRSSTQLSNQHGEKRKAWTRALLQDGSGLDAAEIGRRGRWQLPPTSRTEDQRQTEGRLPVSIRVDSIEILNQASAKRNGSSENGYRVYNIQVAGHPSYSVEGLLVHNCGIKQKRVRLIADEASLMGASFLSAFANLNKNEDFRAIVLGNPNDILDPLGRAAEPIDGWDDHMEPTKTSTWKTRFMNGICVNLIGTDSPNFDFPADKPTRFKYLISREKIAETLSFFPKDSFEYYSQCVGCMKIGAMARRVLTRRMCEQGEALKTDVIWKNSNRIRVYFVDAGYGGDRCVAGWAEFGHDMNGKLIFMAHPPAIIPISMTANKEPEQQIAEYVKEDCESLGIPPQNMGHDATGRGSLGTYLARVWSAQTNPIESGGNPTDRPVDQDTYIIDPKTKVRRLKTCKEAYVKLVTEFWFSVRLAVQAGQVRGMTEEVMEEFCMREWENVAGDRKMVEAKKEMKERIGRSPDLGDFFSGALEMARRKGFLISKLSNESVVSNANSNWLEDMKRKQELLLKKQQLKV